MPTRFLLVDVVRGLSSGLKNQRKKVFNVYRGMYREILLPPGTLSFCCKLCAGVLYRAIKTAATTCKRTRVKRLFNSCYTQILLFFKRFNARWTAQLLRSVWATYGCCVQDLLQEQLLYNLCLVYFRNYKTKTLNRPCKTVRIQNIIMMVLF